MSVGRGIIAFFAVQAIVNVVSICPQNVKCKSTVAQHICEKGSYYRENVKSLGCCPGCVKLKGKGEMCKLTEECAPGYFCRSRVCDDDKEKSCNYYKNTDKDWTETEYWQPNCLPNGMYGPKQCKGEKLNGKCFCTDEKGLRILGEAEWLQAKNMKCACSRLVAEKKNMAGLSLHCDDMGNFEELQCNDKICWCSNDRTGIPYTPVVPMSMLGVLPCYDPVQFGSQYLRQCDSILVNSEKASKLLMDHGTSIILPTVNCNSDGSYSRVQSRSGKSYCAFRNNYKITDPNEIKKKNCNCEYDKFVYEKIEGKNFDLACAPDGSYQEVQNQGSVRFKVDSDGIMIREIVAHEGQHENLDN